jgi:hypothetical protein
LTTNERLSETLTAFHDIADTLRTPINQRSAGVESHTFSFLVQLNDNCFVDVPACVLGSTQITDLNVSLVLFLCFFVVVADSSAAQLEPLVVSARSHWLNDGVDDSLGAY